MQNVGRYRALTSLVSIMLLMIFPWACAEAPEPSGSDQSGKHPGAAIAREYCATCHDFVDPELLPKEYWKTVLLRMSAYMGFDRGADTFYGSTVISKSRLDSARIFPNKQIIKTEDWQNLVLFYLDQAPDSMASESPKFVATPSKQFMPRVVPWKRSTVGVTYVKILAARKLMVGYGQSSHRNFLTIVATKGQLLDEVGLPSAVTSVAWSGDRMYLACMGPFDADDTPLGTILQADFDRDEVQIENLKPLLIARQRPVHISTFTSSLKDDPALMVSEFGKFLGGLYLYQHSGIASMEASVVYEKPGTLMTIVRDVNEDGLPDVYALMGQGDEGVYLYTNKGDGSFESKKILSFPPYFGSVHFQLLDFDGDGLEDIVCNHGDSGDFGTPPKPFHGIRLFKNHGEGVFEETWFVPQQGSYKSSIVDFDEDGDLDIASIGFFARSAGRPEEGFMYLENRGGVRDGHPFMLSSVAFPDTLSFISLDHGDIDGDGDIDLLLGASSLLLDEVGRTNQSSEWERQGGALIWLENTLR